MSKRTGIKPIPTASLKKQSITFRASVSLREELLHAAIFEGRGRSLTDEIVRRLEQSFDRRDMIKELAKSMLEQTDAIARASKAEMQVRQLEQAIKAMQFRFESDNPYKKKVILTDEQIKDGWQLVPKVPSQRMLEAAFSLPYRLETPEGRAQAMYVYSAMLREAPYVVEADDRPCSGRDSFPYLPDGLAS